jgi:hypothetical protein
VSVETNNSSVEAVESGPGHRSLVLLGDPSAESLKVALLHESGAALSPLRFGDNATLRVVAHLPGSGGPSVLVDLSAPVSVETNHGLVEAVESSFVHALLELSVDPFAPSLKVAFLEESGAAPSPLRLGDDTSLGSVTELPSSSRVSVLVDLLASIAVETDNRFVESVELSLVHATSLELFVDPSAESLEVASLHESS